MRPRSHRVTRRGSALVACLLALGGCTEAPDGRAVQDRYEPDLSNVVEEAQEAGAGDEQLAVLTAAVARGEMTYDELESLMPSLLECYERAGFRAGVVGHREDIPGLPVPDAQIAPVDPGVPIDTQARLMNKCDQQYYSEALGYYVSQPRAMDLYYEDFEKRRPDIEACLQEHGFEVTTESSNSDIMRALSEDQSNSPCFDGGVMPFD